MALFMNTFFQLFQTFVTLTKFSITLAVLRTELRTNILVHKNICAVQKEANIVDYGEKYDSLHDGD